jgi:release factor glutamine methyltransferase
VATAREPMLDSPESGADVWTIRRVLAWATDDFRRRGLDSPRLEAELLLSHALGTDRLRLVLDSETTLSPPVLSTYRELIKRRRRSEPIAYITGVREFFGLSIHVDARVLVPRPDTETLVETALERTRDAHLYGQALDLCTGSGCVAIAFSKRRPTWHVTATDISTDALDVARDNARRLGAVWGVEFHESDLDAALAPDARFDLITANPPYIPSAELAHLAPDIREHEPRLALDGGADGLDVARRVIRRAAERLRPGGVLAVEIGAGQADTTFALFEAAGFVRTERRRDYGGIDRVVSGEMPE